jgi:hypothetical protein
MRTAESIMATMIDELKQDARTPEGRERLAMMTGYWDTIREHRERLQLKILMLQETLRVEDEKFATTFDELTG